MIINPIHAVGNIFFWSRDHMVLRVYCRTLSPKLIVPFPRCAESCVTLAHRILLVFFLFSWNSAPPLFHICALSWNSRLSSSRPFPPVQLESEIRRNPEFRDPPQISPPPPPFLDTRGPAALTEFPSGEVRRRMEIIHWREERGIRREMSEEKGPFSFIPSEISRFDVSWTPSFDCCLACDSMLRRLNTFLALDQFRLLPGSPIPAPAPVRDYGSQHPLFISYILSGEQEIAEWNEESQVISRRARIIEGIFRYAHQSSGK